MCDRGIEDLSTETKACLHAKGLLFRHQLDDLVSSPFPRRSKLFMNLQEDTIDAGADFLGELFRASGCSLDRAECMIDALVSIHNGVGSAAAAADLSLPRPMVRVELDDVRVMPLHSNEGASPRVIVSVFVQILLSRFEPPSEGSAAREDSA